jgi:hypothetical protein
LLFRFGSDDQLMPVGISTDVHTGLERFFSAAAGFPTKIPARKLGFLLSV